jgi:uncharacterized membrane protein
MSRPWFGAMSVVLLAAYPLAVYWSLGHLSARWMACLLLALLGARLLLGGAAFGYRATAAVAALLAFAALVGNAMLPLKLYPAAVNGVLLVVFALSLRQPQTLIERIARLTQPDLPPEGVAYTRRVTLAWCVFFAANGTIALVTALAGSDEVWMLYNGLLAYGLIGLMFAGEWGLRLRAQRRWAKHG